MKKILLFLCAVFLLLGTASCAPWIDPLYPYGTPPPPHYHPVPPPHHHPTPPPHHHP